MGAESKCTACDIKRTLIQVVPAPNRHEMRSFECPQCGSIFRFVVRRKRLPSSGFLTKVDGRGYQ
jgi:hypothetical protein